jgi:hypothetical protein
MLLEALQERNVVRVIPFFKLSFVGSWACCKAINTYNIDNVL